MDSKKEISLFSTGFVRQSQEQQNHSAQLARAIYILGVLCKYFDLEKSEYNELQVIFSTRF